MNWSRDTLFNKAKLYAQRAHAEDIESSVFGFWMSLSLELLARSALAQFHPVLLADPTQEGNIHYAFGVNPKHNPKSIQAKAVFARCSVLVPGFTDKMSAYCLIIANRRNEELHTGLAAFEALESSTWLPQTYEVLGVLLEHLRSDFPDLLGDEQAEFASQMLKDRHEHIEKEVKDRVAKAKREFEALDTEARSKLVLAGESWIKKWPIGPLRHTANCPACSFTGALQGESLNRGPARIDAGSITREVRALPNAFACPTCKLKLKGYQELLQVNLGKVFSTYEEEDPIEFFGIIPEDHVDIDDLLARQYEEQMWGYQNE